MLLWIADAVLLVAFFVFQRWMFQRLQEYPANIFGRVRRSRRPSSFGTTSL
jgi:hypothetical protein